MSNKKQPVIDVEDDDFGCILNCAVRYSMGSRTYMPSLVVQYITPLLPYVNNRTLCVFKQDYESPLGIGEPYGDPKIDKPVWDGFYEKVCEEYKRRKLNNDLPR